ncbi:MAG TPA: hypothetical protein VMS08_02665, partial [Candidatus Saccharimonadia bacterium]|nr:hypothetical protein [Candidatus Saccharimonadia bacterium]
VVGWFRGRGGNHSVLDPDYPHIAEVSGVSTADAQRIVRCLAAAGTFGYWKGDLGVVVWLRTADQDPDIVTSAGCTAPGASRLPVAEPVQLLKRLASAG